MEQHQGGFAASGDIICMVRWNFTAGYWRTNVGVCALWVHSCTAAGNDANGPRSSSQYTQIEVNQSIGSEEKMIAKKAFR